MQSIQSFVVRGTKNTQHYFLHMSLHELCAARHLATLQPSEQLAVLSDYLEGKAVGMENILGFFSALGGWNSKVVKEFLFHMLWNCVERDIMSNFNICRNLLDENVPRVQNSTTAILS